MGRKKSLFSGGSRSIRTQVANADGKPHPPDIDDSKGIPRQTRADRRILPSVNLKGGFVAENRGRECTFHYDLNNLAANFPHHERLINQLVAGVSYARRGTSGKNLDIFFKSISEFVEFLNGDHNLSNTPVSLVSDITITVCSAYRSYLISRFPGRTINSQRYGALRQIVTSLQEEFVDDPSVGAPLHWPIGPRNTSKPRQGYTPGEMGELIAFCQRDITETKRLHSMYVAARTGDVILDTEWNLPNLMFYLRERLAEPQERTIGEFIRLIVVPSPNAKKFLSRNDYSIKDITRLFKSRGEDLAEGGRYPGKRLQDWTLKNFMYWVKYRWENSPQKYRPVNQKIKAYIKGVPDATRFLESNGYSPDQIVSLYLERGEELAGAGRDPFGHKFNRCGERRDETTFKLILGTLAQKFPEYPFGMSLEAATDFLNQNRYFQMEGEMKRSTEGRVLRAITLTRTNFVYGGTIGCTNLIRASMHFLLETLYPFLLHVQINTGWNLESVLALTDNVDAHVTDDLIDPENYVVIQSAKRRGQDNGTKAIFHRCSRHKQFSTYRLLKYVESIVTRYKGCHGYKPGRLWQFAVRSHSSMTQLISYVGESSAHLHSASKFSLRRHTFTYFKGMAIDHGRIRSSYETLRELQGLPLSMVSHDMDHENEETTSKYYASDKTSNSVKDLKVAGYQEQIVDDLRHFECRVVESLTLAKLRDAICQSHTEAERKRQLAKAAEELGSDEKAILHLISPEGQTFIAACRDSANPTWAGHEEYLRPGQPCSFFNKCGSCKQAVIFPEALPYIARRQLDLEQLRGELNTFEWMSAYGEEWDAWEGVLNDWGNREQVDAARRAAVRGDVVLPIRLRGPR